MMEFLRNLFDFTAKLLRVKPKALSGNRLAKLRFAYYNYKLGSSIAENANFAAPPYFPHGARGVFISGGARIGAGATIFQHVTIGSNTLPGSRGYGCPMIGDNCFIGAGAVIIGSVQVGDNVRIGAGAIVCKNVPDNAVVVSQPCRIILKKDLDNTFFTYKDGQTIQH